MSKQQQDASQMLTLTDLEAAVLRETAKQLPPQDRAALEEQIDGISVRNRENTGAGFYTHFALKPTPLPQVLADVKGCHVVARINGVDDALGFILWLKEGYVDYLEGYTMSLARTVGMDLAALSFDLTSAPPISNG